jgi:glycosyltransferase involved in cell wall biosynthesis
MIGPASGARGGAASLVDTWRAQGLFKRWPVQYLPVRGDASWLEETQRFGRAVRDFSRLLAEHRRFAVHVHITRAGVAREVFFMAIALAAHCPLVIQLHGAGFDPALRYFLERAACVLVPCESMKAQLRNQVRSAHVVCLPPAVGLEPIAPAEKPALVVFLGRLEAAKGIYDLLDAVAALRKDVPELRLACAGDGDRVGVARYAERLGIAEAVKFTGWVGPSGKRALLEHAAVFALPSAAEGLPVSLIEAMSAGVPVVASPVGGVPEAVQDGVSGLLVAPGDKLGLERALRKLLSDRAFAARLGGAARESARLRFSPERVLPRLEELYARLGVRDGVEPAPRERELKKAA